MMNLSKIITGKSAKRTRREAPDFDVIGDRVPEGDFAAAREHELFEAARLENVARRENIDERRRYAGRLFAVIVCWFSALFVLLLFEGFLDNSVTTLSFHAGSFSAVVQ